MPNIAELLKDKSKYPDALEVTIGTEKVSLADLRAADAAGGGNLAQQLEEERKALQRERDQLSQAQLSLADTFAKLDRTAAQPAAPSATPSGFDLENDPIFAPVMKRLTAIEKEQIAAMQQKLEQQQQQMNAAIATVLNYRFEDQFAALPEDFRKDNDLNKLVRYASENQIVDRYKVPDLRAAHERMTAAQRKAKELEDAEKRGYEKAAKERASAAAVAASPGSPRPGSGGPAIPAPQYKDLAQAISAARQDSGLMEMFEKARAGAMPPQA